MLIACKECGASISDKAVTCPNCGIPFEGKVKQAYELHQSEPYAKSSDPWLNKTSSSGKDPWVKAAAILFVTIAGAFLILTLKVFVEQAKENINSREQADYERNVEDFKGKGEYALIRSKTCNQLSAIAGEYNLNAYMSIEPKDCNSEAAGNAQVYLCQHLAASELPYYEQSSVVNECKEAGGYIRYCEVRSSDGICDKFWWLKQYEYSS